jgi:hypothetical protein
MALEQVQAPRSRPPHQLLQQVRRVPDAGGSIGLVARAPDMARVKRWAQYLPVSIVERRDGTYWLVCRYRSDEERAPVGFLRPPGGAAHALRDGVLMELRPENLTLLQRHLLSLLAKTRQGQRPPWLVVETGRVKVEPFAQVLQGRAASVAARGLKSMGWLRARSSGGLELAHPRPPSPRCSRGAGGPPRSGTAVASGLAERGARRGHRAGGDELPGLRRAAGSAVRACAAPSWARSSGSSPPPKPFPQERSRMPD